MFQPKIATCNYCGRRTTLTPTAMKGHELACSSCGAPLHLMKPMPVKAAASAASHAPAPTPHKITDRKPRKVKKRKSIWKKLLSEAIDGIEDIFD